jgi:hypothetical protein
VRMRKRFFMILGLVLGVTTLSIHAQQQVAFFARIVDGSGAPVAKLEPTDVRILENDVETKILKIDPINWPMKVQVLIDNGIGLGNDNLVTIRGGAKGLIEALPEGTEITLVTTAPQPRIIVKPTTDRAAVLKGVDLLTPDSGTGRFVEALNEAMQRVEKDKAEFFPVIFLAGSNTGGDANNVENTYMQLMKRLQNRPATIHIVLFSKSPGGVTGSGNVQTEVGLQVTKATGGRFEAINSGTRLATLLPEYGAQIAKSQDNQSHQFRITVARANGGAIGKISMSTRGGLSATSLSMDGRIP